MSTNNTLFFEFWQSDLNIYKYPLNTTGAIQKPTEEYFNSTQWDWGLQFAREGEKMAFVSSRSGHHEVWIAPENEPDKAQRITQLKGPFIRSMNISPDGEKILFVLKEKGLHSLYYLRSNGQDLQCLNQK